MATKRQQLSKLASDSRHLLFSAMATLWIAMSERGMHSWDHSDRVVKTKIYPVK